VVVQAVSALPGDLVRIAHGAMLYPIHGGDADIVEVDIELPDMILATVIATNRSWRTVWAYGCLWTARCESLLPID
jgi:hypothetical protein